MRMLVVVTFGVPLRTSLSAPLLCDACCPVSLITISNPPRAKPGVYLPAFAAARRSAVSTSIGGTGPQ